MSKRAIIHVDMDAFYASVEQRDRPELKGRPVVVGGRPEGRGVVAAASYEARGYGIRSAMPCARAARLCPEAVFVPPDFAKYAEVSKVIRRLFLEVTDLVEPLSLDEAFLDVSERSEAPERIARRLKRQIREQTGLTASAGVGPNKFVAKLASDLDKPDGLVVVRPSEVRELLTELPVRRLWGVGPKTAQRLEEAGLKTIGDVRDRGEGMVKLFGRHGAGLLELAHGQDDRPVVPDRAPKSRGAERTFPKDLRQRDEIEAVIRRLAQEVAAALHKRRLEGRTVVLKVRYANFKTVTRSRTQAHVSDEAEITRLALRLLEDTEAGRRPVRLLGVSVSGLSPRTGEQLSLFGRE
ncbi:MAG: DNA polymerase IV [Myxococcota bacterium]